ncbi:MAG TPA: alpha/beta hydrolase [Ktedonobacterales bacterium]
MPLDPQAQMLLDQLAQLGGKQTFEMTPQEARDDMRAMIGYLGEGEPVASLEDRRIPGPGGEIPVRMYTPQGGAPFPLLVFFHGGGWVVGDIETHDGLCRSLANGAGCVVVSVDYHLAPEHPFPAAPQDCYAATQWAAANADSLQADSTRIAVGGDSAGGNLAAVVALMARDQGGPRLDFQLLIYPALDARMQTPSIDENAEGYMLTKQSMIWYRGHYLQHSGDILNPLASPLLAENLRGLPPALIITAEFDPLRDEGEMYAERLQAAGVSVTHTRYHGMIHGFVSLSSLLDQGKTALAEICQALRKTFATPSQTS